MAMRCRTVGQPDQAAVRSFVREHEHAEVVIDRDDDAVLGAGAVQDDRIAGIRRPRARVHDIVASICQPARELRPGTAVDQEAHALSRP